MRVIAGELKGQRLVAPRGWKVRPTSDRVREATFSALGARVEGARVHDLLAGTGALAIEALSRGARHAVLVERDRRAAAVIRRNLDELGLGPDDAQLRVRDALRALGDARAAAETYDLVLIDPPYRVAEGLGPALAEALPAVLAPSGRVVTESDRRLPLEVAGLETGFERRYGDTLVRILHNA
jgi:16S rRNA (guanine966-N2)-methyltransferase